MNILIEYKDGDGDEHRVGIDNIHGGQPLAESVRQALKEVPDDGYAVALYRDGEAIL